MVITRAAVDQIKIHINRGVVVCEMEYFTLNASIKMQKVCFQLFIYYCLSEVKINNIFAISLLETIQQTVNGHIDYKGMWCL